MKPKRLKDKTWNCCRIKIDRVVEQYKDGIGTTNKTVMYLIDVKTLHGGRTMFNAKTPSEVWRKLKQEVYL